MNSSLFRRARAFRALLGISMLALSGVAMSAPMLVGTTTNASGIDGVVVDAVIHEAAHLTKLGIVSVPEPATLALFGLGLVGVALSRRRLTR